MQEARMVETENTLWQTPQGKVMLVPQHEYKFIPDSEFLALAIKEIENYLAAKRDSVVCYILELVEKRIGSDKKDELIEQYNLGRLYEDTF